MSNKDYFIMLPNKLMCCRDSEESMIIYSNEDKVIPLLIFMDINSTKVGTVNFTLHHMITFCGFKPNRNKGKTNDQFKLMLQELVDGKVITNCNVNMLTAKENDFITCKYNGDKLFKFDKGGNTLDFFTISANVYRKIMNHKCTVSNITLLKLYCYISAKLKRRIRNEHNFPEYTFFKYETAMIDLNIASKNTFSDAIQTLESMGLIFIGRSKSSSYGGNNTNVYCLDKKEVSESLKHAKNIKNF